MHTSGLAGSDDIQEQLAQLDAQLRKIDIAGIHRSHRDSILPHYPNGLQLALKRRYFETATPVRLILLGEDRRKAILEGRSVDSWARANRELTDTHRRLKKAKVHLAWSDGAIRDMARQCADICCSITRNRPALIAYESLKYVATHHQVRMPEPTRGKTLTGCVARLCDPKWWRRAIRSTYARQSEEIERDLGLVSKFTGLYASDDSVARRREQKVRNRDMLEACYAVNDFGECFTLAQLSDVNVSNPKIRRAELMTRIAGFEDFANDVGHAGLFVTVTLPSRFHCTHSQSGKRNARFDGSTVAVGQRFLCKQWSKLRSYLKRNGFEIYGFRIAEPHHDGTPHWHLLLFMDASISDAVVAGFKKYFDPPEESEPGSDQRRVEVVAIDPTKGSAAGYVAKYVSKNIDGFGVGRDAEATQVTGDVTGEDGTETTRESTGATRDGTGPDTRDATETAKRVDAWASTSGIRQFQQIGGPPVTLWRELRRVGTAQQGVIEDARLAVEDQDWKRFWEVLGGPSTRASDRPIQLHTVPGSKPGVYGERVERQIKGVRAGAVIVPTRLRTWTFVQGAGPESGSSWTRVNNCTGTGPRLRHRSRWKARCRRSPVRHRCQSISTGCGIIQEPSRPPRRASSNTGAARVRTGLDASRFKVCVSGPQLARSLPCREVGELVVRLRASGLIRDSAGIPRRLCKR